MEQNIHNFLSSSTNPSIIIIFKNYYNFEFRAKEFDTYFLEQFKLETKSDFKFQSSKTLTLPYYNCSIYTLKEKHKTQNFIHNNSIIHTIDKSNSKTIIRLIQDFNFIYFQFHYQNIIKNPVLLDKKAFPKIKYSYSVTDKADGKRKLLLFSKSISYLVSSENPITFQCKNKLNNYFTILDGEYLEDLNRFLVFDVLFVNGENVQNFNLVNRLKFAELFIKNIQQSDIEINLKKFYFDDDYKNLCQNAYKIYHENYDYKLDGLIYTPIHNDYYNRNKKLQQTYKWKPLDENTIDFFVLKLSDKEYGLVVSTGFKNMNKNVIQKYFNWVSMKGMSFPKIFYKQSLDKYKELQEYENKIVEMYYDNGIFKVLRVREDKMANYEFFKKQNIFRGPNGFKTALNTFEYIKDPIKNNLILCSKSNYWENQANFSNKIYDIKKFHNIVKKYLYTSYLRKFKEPYVLEIGSGRGGDLHKLKINGAKYVLMTNINKGGINEAELRYENMNKQNFKVDFMVSNSSKNIRNSIQNYLDKLNQNKTLFDVISIQFALHYFLKNKTSFENFFNNINQFLNIGGYVFATFLNGNLLHQQFENKNEIKFEGSNHKPLFIIQKKYKNFKNYGSSILVSGKTIGTHEEYLVNTDFLKEYFEKHGYKFIEDGLFSQFKEFHQMKSGQSYSALNYFIVLQKIK